jgi:hypothetical protein
LVSPVCLGGRKGKEEEKEKGGRREGASPMCHLAGAVACEADAERVGRKAVRERMDAGAE